MVITSSYASSSILVQEERMTPTYDRVPPLSSYKKVSHVVQEEKLTPCPLMGELFPGMWEEEEEEIHSIESQSMNSKCFDP